MALLNISSKQKGFSLVELVIAITIFIIYVGGLAAAATGGHLTRLENAKLVQADLFFTEGWEAVKSIRNNNWSDITNGTHGLISSSGFWQFSGSSDSFNGFTRIITINDVRRDNGGNIVSSGGEIDSDTKLVSVDISWSPVSSKNLAMSSESYLTNYENPDVWTPSPPEPPPEP